MFIFCVHHFSDTYQNAIQNVAPNVLTSMNAFSLYSALGVLRFDHLFNYDLTLVNVFFVIRVLSTA